MSSDPAPETDLSQRLAELGHELRTPLNAILGFSDALRARLHGPLDPRYGDYADLIHEAGRHMLELVEGLQALSGPLQAESIDARDPVRAALRLVSGLADEAGLALVARLPPEPLAIRGEARALRQIALNLLANAIRFTPAGGQVTVTLASAAGGLLLEVQDTGPGIAPEDIPRLGRPYAQAGEPAQRLLGADLGLYLARGLALRHGGELEVRSAPGRGACAAVRLPPTPPED